MSVNEKMTAIADAIRARTGGTQALTLDDMVAAITGITGDGTATGLDYDMGEFVLDADTVTGRDVVVPHNLGTTPEFICVWSDHWAGLTSDAPVAYEDGKQTAVGFIWLKEITGMAFRASSTNSGTPMCFSFVIANNDYRVGAVSPTSGVYGMADDFVSATTFSPPTFGANGPRYRAGVTYHYFVSKAWWNVGGAADAE